MQISYPLLLTGSRLGRLKYPKSEENILIYVADHLHLFPTVDQLIQELSITVLEEITHAFDASNVSKHHNYSDFIKALIY